MWGRKKKGVCVCGGGGGGGDKTASFLYEQRKEKEGRNKTAYVCGKIGQIKQPFLCETKNNNKRRNKTV